MGCGACLGRRAAAAWQAVAAQPLLPVPLGLALHEAVPPLWQGLSGSDPNIPIPFDCRMQVMNCDGGCINGEGQPESDVSFKGPAGRCRSYLQLFNARYLRSKGLPPAGWRQPSRRRLPACGCLRTLHRNLRLAQYFFLWLATTGPRYCEEAGGGSVQVRSRPAAVLPHTTAAGACGLLMDPPVQLHCLPPTRPCGMLVDPVQLSGLPPTPPST